MSTDELITALTDWLTTRYPGDPGLSLVIRLVSGREVPLPLPATVAPIQRAECVPAERREPDEPPVATAILCALEDAGERMTGGQFVELFAARTARDEEGFSPGNILKTCCDLHSAGRLTNYRKDPRDGIGKGYGLPQWESQSTERGTHERAD